MECESQILFRKSPGPIYSGSQKLWVVDLAFHIETKSFEDLVDKFGVNESHVVVEPKTFLDLFDCDFAAVWSVYQMERLS